MGLLGVRFALPGFRALEEADKERSEPAESATNSGIRQESGSSRLVRHGCFPSPPSATFPPPPARLQRRDSAVLERRELP